MSDTPLSKLLKQGSSLTSYNIGQVAKLEAHIAALTAELAAMKAERDAAIEYAATWVRDADAETIPRQGRPAPLSNEEYAEIVRQEVREAINAAREG